MSRTLVYLVERGEPTTFETYVRLGAALGLRVDLAFEDPRAKGRPARSQDPVHAAIVEQLAARYAAQARLVAVDEPFQHYQFAGRADLAVIDPAGPDLLHHEVKTAIPNVGELAGAWNVKRRYLARVLAGRYASPGGFRSVTHVLTIAWTAECLHVIRLRGATIRALGFDSAWSASRTPARSARATRGMRRCSMRSAGPAGPEGRRHGPPAAPGVCDAARCARPGRQGLRAAGRTGRA